MAHLKMIGIIHKEMIKNNNQNLYTRAELKGLAKFMYFDLVNHIKFTREPKFLGVDFYSNGVTLSAQISKGYIFLMGDCTTKMLLGEVCDIKEL